MNLTEQYDLSTIDPASLESDKIYHIFKNSI